MIEAWRIVDARWADDAFSGEGARRFKGRWHDKGTRVVYTASSISLATLELLVQVPRANKLGDFCIVACSFPEAIAEDLDRTKLPKNWRDYPAPPELQHIGSAWVADGESAVLAVPSAVTPEEINYLINPEHPDFHSVKVSLPRPFRPDLRLLT